MSQKRFLDGEREQGLEIRQALDSIQCLLQSLEVNLRPKAGPLLASLLGGRGFSLGSNCRVPSKTQTS